MNDNLNQLIQETPADETMKFDVNNLELPAEEPIEENSAEEEEVSDTGEQESENVETSPVEQATNQIPIISFGDWFRTYRTNFPAIHQSQIGITGVDPNDYLMVSIDNSDGEELSPGVIKRWLRLFDDAMIQPVLNLEPSDIKIYKSTFKVIYPLDEQTFIKMYAIRTGIISVFCHGLDGGLVPYSIVISKKKAEFVEIQTHDIELYRAQLSQPVNMETFHLLYKQSLKADNFTTKGQAINWLLARQDNITDINHHLAIDKVIMTLLS